MREMRGEEMNKVCVCGHTHMTAANSIVPALFGKQYRIRHDYCQDDNCNCKKFVVRK
jgi:hypothetical protein